MPLTAALSVSVVHSSDWDSADAESSAQEQGRVVSV